MEEKDLIRFVEKIVLCNNIAKIRLELGQLCKILKENSARQELLDRLQEWIDAAPELCRLCGKASSGTRLTTEDMDNAVKHAALRHKEEVRNGRN